MSKILARHSRSLLSGIYTSGDVDSRQETSGMTVLLNFTTHQPNIDKALAVQKIHEISVTASANKRSKLMHALE
jgi:hypothetical protein